MKIPTSPHQWNVTPKEAVQIQQNLAGQIAHQPLKSKVRTIAGVDSAFSQDGKMCIAGVVLWDMNAKQPLEEHVVFGELTFPYVPGLLSFREAPHVINALRKLSQQPDVIMVDGHGVAHMRRLGIASHIGLITQIPTIGCAKSRLVGTHKNPARKRGSAATLIHKGEKIGSVVRTQDGINPLYVSVGHKIDLSSAHKLVLQSSTKYRLPEPTRLADKLVARTKMDVSSNSNP